MSNITDWIKYELYPSLFESIDVAFPEHDFKVFSGGWRSKTYLNGSPHSRHDKTIVSKKAPGIILEQGGEALSLVDYVMRRDQVNFIQGVETLAKIVNLQLPKEDFNPEDYQKTKDRTTILETANSYFIYCLGQATGSKEARDYLASRGYSEEDIEAMELGYIPSQEKLFKHLQSKDFTQAQIEEALPLNKGIGSTHKLSIPYRSGGSIKGFKFRTIGEDTPKYLNSTGLDKSGGFFNLSGIKGNKDLVIVEGELDSLHATAKGIDNVVATGGKSISPGQIQDAIRRGAKTFTLCFDREPDKEVETAKNINSAIEVILGEGVNRVYIVILPDLGGGKTDPDRLIKESGAEAFKQAIKQAYTDYSYRLELLRQKYLAIQERQGEIYLRDIDHLQEDVLKIGSTLEPLDRDQFKSLFLASFSGLGITEESLSITMDRLTSTKEKEARDKEINSLLSKAQELQSKGETGEVLDLLEGKIKDIKLKGASSLLPPPMSFNTLLEDIATIPQGYRTGYPSLDKFIDFTPGAISLIAGRPSHGKTTFMFNLLLEMAKLYPEEKFYFFSYEEPVRNISVKLLNRLTGMDLKPSFSDYNLSTPTNYEFLKNYIKTRRTDIPWIEEGKRQLKELIDSQRITLIGENYSVEDLSKLIGHLQKKEKIGAVFIDYIQRMRTERRTQDKRTEIAHISDQTLQIAKDTGLPIILGAQLNRATTSTANKKPTLENLKEAGNLEEDANLVLSVYNESREKEETPEGESYKGAREVELEIKTLKNREGEVNQTASLTFDKWTGLVKESQKNYKSSPF